MTPTRFVEALTAPCRLPKHDGTLSSLAFQIRNASSQIIQRVRKNILLRPPYLGGFVAQGRAFNALRDDIHALRDLAPAEAENLAIVKTALPKIM